MFGVWGSVPVAMGGCYIFHMLCGYMGKVWQVWDAIHIQGYPLSRPQTSQDVGIGLSGSTKPPSQLHWGVGCGERYQWSWMGWKPFIMSCGCMWKDWQSLGCNPYIRMPSTHAAYCPLYWAMVGSICKTTNTPPLMCGCVVRYQWPWMGCHIFCMTFGYIWKV